ncbi:MAG: hypothetical protein ACOYEP_12215, partial [Limnochordia bacterium]
MSASPISRAPRSSKGRWQKGVWLAVMAMTMAVLAGGCSLLPMRNLNRLGGASQESQTPGRLMVAANVSSIPTLTEDGSSVTLIVSKDGRQHVQEVPVVDSKASATVGDLLPGLWNVVLRVSDQSGQPIYEAEGEVTILPDGIATLELVLRPLPGTLIVSVNPQAHPQLSEAQQGRLYINPGGYTTMTREPNGTLTATKPLAAGTYDYSIALFGATFYAKDRIYESHWDTVTILPGQTTSLQWDPVTGECVVIGNVDNPPPAP